jgi:hypothetical protein
MTNVTVLNPILDIPANDVGDIVQKFVDYDHVTKIEIVKQPDGKFTVVPTKSD